MNKYKNLPDGKPDRIFAGLPIIKPDLHKVWGFIRRGETDGPDEIWVNINFHDLTSDPGTGENIYNLCAQVVLPQSMALVLAQDLMINALFKEAIGRELSERFSFEIIERAMELGKKLDALLDEYKKRDDEEYAREMATGYAAGEEYGQAKD